MVSRKFILTIYACFLGLILILGGKIAHSKDESLKIIFLDVGQGDAILIENASNQMIIDGGASGKIILEKLGKYIPFWDRDIEIAVATHPDQDHIGGLIDVLENYNIKKIISNGVLSQSQVSEKFQAISKEKNISNLEVSSGTKIKLAPDLEAEILAPDGSQAKDNPKDTNSSSVIIKLTYGDNSFLLAGDATTEAEEKLVKGNADVFSNVLKAGHHGSKYSTSDEFLNKVNPREAVISVGKNSYGHPSAEVIQKLEDRGIEILRTDEMGDIIYKCENKKCFLTNN